MVEVRRSVELPQAVDRMISNENGILREDVELVNSSDDEMIEVS